MDQFLEQKATVPGNAGIPADEIISVMRPGGNNSEKRWIYAAPETEFCHPASRQARVQDNA